MLIGVQTFSRTLDLKADSSHLKSATLCYVLRHNNGMQEVHFIGSRIYPNLKPEYRMDFALNIDMIPDLLNIFNEI